MKCREVYGGVKCQCRRLGRRHFEYVSRRLCVSLTRNLSVLGVPVEETENPAGPRELSVTSRIMPIIPDDVSCERMSGCYEVRATYINRRQMNF